MKKKKRRKIKNLLNLSVNFTIIIFIKRRKSIDIDLICIDFFQNLKYDREVVCINLYKIIFLNLANNNKLVK